MAPEIWSYFGGGAWLWMWRRVAVVTASKAHLPLLQLPEAHWAGLASSLSSQHSLAPCKWLLFAKVRAKTRVFSHSWQLSLSLLRALLRHILRSTTLMLLLWSTWPNKTGQQTTGAGAALNGATRVETEQQTLFCRLMTSKQYVLEGRMLANYVCYDTSLCHRRRVWERERRYA